MTLFRAVYGTLRGALQGAGETRPPLVATTLGIGLFTLGFSWLVGVQLGIGIVGVYLGVGLDFVFRAVVLGTWCHRGHWRRSLPAPARHTGTASP